MCISVQPYRFFKMDGDSDASDASFTLQIMRALGTVRGGNWDFN